MSGATHISWADKTWNPVLGCTKVGAGCDGCYAIGEAWRHSFALNAKVHAAYEGLTRKVNGKAAWTNVVRCLPERLTEPLHWRKPCTIFVNSMSDTFHSDVPDEFLDQMFAVMALAHWHRFMVLTKRPERMLEYLSDPETPGRIALQMGRIMSVLHGVKGIPQNSELPSPEDGLVWPLPNVIGMVSAEDQRAANERIPILLRTPLARRGVSLEPLLGPVDLKHIDYSWQVREMFRYLSEQKQVETPSPPNGTAFFNALTGDWFDGWDSGSEPLQRLDLVIAGGESGLAARPSHPDWFRSLRDQCAAAGVDYHFKQWGEWAPSHRMPGQEIAEAACQWPGDAQPMARLGKKLAGRLLDGVEHNGTGWNA